MESSIEALLAKPVASASSEREKGDKLEWIIQHWLTIEADTRASEPLATPKVEI